VPELLAKLSEEVTSRSTPGGRGSPWPPASEAEVASFEQQIGARLPALWREIFTTIGNGGFGPGYGIYGLITGAPDDQGQVALRLFESFNQSDPEDPAWRWPGHLVPIAHWGCAVQSCIDVSTSDGRMVRFDPNDHGPDEGWEGAWWEEAPSSVEWWTAWLDHRLSFERGVVS
jgi:hypothetical protein